MLAREMLKQGAFLAPSQGLTAEYPFLTVRCIPYKTESSFCI